MLLRELVTTKSVPATLKAWYRRITLNRFTLCFFVLAFANSVAQTTIMTMQFVMSMQGRDFVSDIVFTAGIQKGFSVIEGNQVMLCNGIPNQAGTTCIPASNSSISPVLATRALRLYDQVVEDTLGTAQVVDEDGVVVGVHVTDAAFGAATLSLECVESLTPLETFLRDAMSEDITHFIFHTWQFLLSVVGLLSESIPHLIVVLASHALNTAWASFRVYTDKTTRDQYTNVIVGDMCGGVDVLGGWREEGNLIALIGVNAVVFFIMCFLVYKIIRGYLKTTLTSVGAPRIISRMYNLVLWLYVALQFSAFFMMASAAVWYNKLSSDIEPATYKKSLYFVPFYVTSALIVPWYVLGAFAMRRECRWMFALFFSMTLGFIGMNATWFTSPVFIYELGAWSFFGAFTCFADFMLIVTVILAFFCRLQFGKGLAHYLWVQQMLEETGFPEASFINPTSGVTGDKSGKPIRRNTSGGLSVILRDKINKPPISHRTSTDSTSSVESSVLQTWRSNKKAQELQNMGVFDICAANNRFPSFPPARPPAFPPALPSPTNSPIATTNSNGHHRGSDFLSISFPVPPNHRGSFNGSLFPPIEISIQRTGHEEVSPSDARCSPDSDIRRIDRAEP